MGRLIAILKAEVLSLKVFRDGALVSAIWRILLFEKQQCTLNVARYIVAQITAMLLMVIEADDRR